MSFWKNLFEKWTCKHKWIVHKTVRSYDVTRLTGALPVKVRQILICTECGKFKSIDL